MSGLNGHLRRAGSSGTLTVVDEEQGIYRGEVFTMMGALADIRADVRQILIYLRGDDDEEEEEEDLPDS